MYFKTKKTSKLLVFSQEAIPALRSGFLQQKRQANCLSSHRKQSLRYARGFCNKKDKQFACLFCFEIGIVLLSRAVSSQVPSALISLTSVFGMRTGDPYRHRHRLCLNAFAHSQLHSLIFLEFLLLVLNFLFKTRLNCIFLF